MVLYKLESGYFTFFSLLSQVVSGLILNDSWVHTPVFLFFILFQWLLNIYIYAFGRHFFNRLVLSLWIKSIFIL